jgi:hypothetical protein
MSKSNFVFTRYLYEKEEVKLSLLISILKRKEEACFWAYELYYSGFKEELKTLFWSIYYDFFATLNPAFNIYLLKQFKETFTEKIVGQLVEDFKIRPFNLDVFMLRHYVKQFEIEPEPCDLDNNNNFLDIHDGDYTRLASYILDDIAETKLITYLEHAIVFFELKGIKINKKKMIGDFTKTTSYCKRVILLSQILYLFSMEKQLKMGKNLYIAIEPEDIVMYETILADDKNKIKAYKILEFGRMYEIDCDNYLSLFRLKREKEDIRTAFLDNWLYYVLETPFWREKIIKHNGLINNEDKVVYFNEDTDDFDNFWDLYNYEPDEQKKIVQDKSIRPLLNIRTWKIFYNENKGSGLVHIDDEFLDEFEIHF